MRWGRGVLLIEKCQAIGMQQVHISGCKPWNRLGSAALVADIRLALAALLPTGMQDLDWIFLITLDCDPTANTWPEFCPQNIEQNPSFSVLPKRIQGIVTLWDKGNQIGKKFTAGLLRKMQSQCYK